MKQNPRLGHVRKLAALLVATVLGAAPAPAPAPAQAAAEEAVVLNPFVVSSAADTGYAATNTLEGSRLNTALRDTPAAISVFTKDFLDDIGATDLASLLRYDLSTEFEYNDANSQGTGGQLGSIDGGVGWRTRGLTGAAATNGFRDAGGADDLYNVERVARPADPTPSSSAPAPPVAC